VRPPRYKLVQITPISLWLMVFITTVTGADLNQLISWGPHIVCLIWSFPKMGLLPSPPWPPPSHWYSTSGLNGTKTLCTKDNSVDSGPMNALSGDVSQLFVGEKWARKTTFLWEKPLLCGKNHFYVG